MILGLRPANERRRLLLGANLESALNYLAADGIFYIRFLSISTRLVWQYWNKIFPRKIHTCHTCACWNYLHYIITQFQAWDSLPLPPCSYAGSIRYTSSYRQFATLGANHTINSIINTHASQPSNTHSCPLHHPPSPPPSQNTIQKGL